MGFEGCMAQRLTLTVDLIQMVRNLPASVKALEMVFSGITTGVCNEVAVFIA